MSYVAAEILKEVMGSVAAETMGHDVHFDPVGGASVNGPTVAVDMTLNEESLRQAEGRALHRHNEQNRKLGLEVPNASPSVGAAEDRRTQAENKYASLFAKSGLAKTMERTMAPTMARGIRRDYRSAMPAAPASDRVPKNPLMRIQQRRLRKLRQTFDEISARRSMTQPFNAEQLPQLVQERILENAMREGQSVTPVGTVPEVIEKIGMKFDQRSVKFMPGQKSPLMQGPKPRQWAMINPELIPSGWATH